MHRLSEGHSNARSSPAHERLLASAFEWTPSAVAGARFELGRALGCTIRPLDRRRSALWTLFGDRYRGSAWHRRDLLPASSVLASSCPIRVGKEFPRDDERNAPDRGSRVDWRHAHGGSRHEARNDRLAVPAVATCHGIPIAILYNFVAPPMNFASQHVRGRDGSHQRPQVHQGLNQRRKRFRDRACPLSPSAIARWTPATSVRNNTGSNPERDLAYRRVSARSIRWRNLLVEVDREGQWLRYTNARCRH